MNRKSGTEKSEAFGVEVNGVGKRRPTTQSPYVNQGGRALTSSTQGFWRRRMVRGGVRKETLESSGRYAGGNNWSGHDPRLVTS